MLQRPQTSERIRAAVPVIAVHVLLAFVLLRGLASHPPPAEDPQLKLIQLTPEQVPPPEPPPPPPPSRGSSPARERSDPRPEGAASPPNLKAQPRPVVAPEPVVRVPLPPPPVPAAPVAGTGFAPSAGAAPVRGPGTGSGGSGTGTGSGSGGSGTGGGGGGGGAGYGSGRVFTMPRLLRGDFSYGDIPDELQDAGFRGMVGIRFIVDPDGRPRDCRIIRRSGNRLMDEAACRALEQRFRFAPGRDEEGRPVPVPGELFPYFEADRSGNPEGPPRRRRMGF